MRVKYDQCLNKWNNASLLNRTLPLKNSKATPVKPGQECSATGMGVLPHLQMGVAVMGFDEDIRYGLHNS